MTDELGSGHRAAAETNDGLGTQFGVGFVDHSPYKNENLRKISTYLFLHILRIIAQNPTILIDSLFISYTLLDSVLPVRYLLIQRNRKNDLSYEF